MAGLVPFHTDGMACTHMAWPVLRWHGLFSDGLACSQMAWPVLRWHGLFSDGMACIQLQPTVSKQLLCALNTDLLYVGQQVL